MRYALLLIACGLGYAQTYSVGTTPFTSSSRAEGSVTAANGFSNACVFVSSDGVCRWGGQHANIDVSYFAAADSGGHAGSGATICLYVDGTLTGSCIVGAGDSAIHTSSGQWTGLNTSTTHSYELVNVGTNASASVATNGWLNIITQVIVSGGSGLGTQPATRPLMIFCGDSILGGNSSLIFDARQLDPWQVARALGYSDVHYAEYGALITGSLKTDCPNIVGNTMAGAPASTYAVVLQGGVNDANATVTMGTAGVGCATGTFECDYYNQIRDVWSHSPNKVYARGIAPASYNSGGASLDTDIATYNAGILAAANQWTTDNPSEPVTYISPVGWFDYVVDTSSDHLHPKVSGYAKMQNREIPIFSGVAGTASFTVSGVTSVAAPNQIVLTLTMVGGAKFQDPFTYTSSVGGDTVCFNGTNCGGGAATLPAGANTNTVTVTLTASTVGSRTLTPSGMPNGWTSPGVTSVSVSTNTSNQLLFGEDL